MSARLATKLTINALVRRAAAQGDFATVIRKGDETAGQILLLTRARDGACRVYARTMNRDGAYTWTVAVDGQQEELAKVNEYLDRQARYDPDLWVIELDTANPERLIDDELI